jgi:hypothetical protein
VFRINNCGHIAVTMLHGEGSASLGRAGSAAWGGSRVSAVVVSSALGILSALCVSVGFVLAYCSYRAARGEVDRVRSELVSAHEAGRSYDARGEYVDQLLLREHMRAMVLKELAPSLSWSFGWVAAGVLLQIASSIAGLFG